MIPELALIVALTATPAQDRVLDAIRTVESSSNPNAVGDNGAAIGAYQLHRAYHADSRVPGEYRDCFSEPYARRVVEAYMKRYEPRAWARADAEVIARAHNGGCGWRKNRRATDGYWSKVKAALTRTTKGTK